MSLFIDQYALGAADQSVIKSCAAARAVDLSDYVARQLFDRIVGVIGLEPLARLVLKVSTIADLDTLSGPEFDALTAELDQLKDVQAVEVGSVVTTGPVPVIEIVATQKNAKGRTSVSVIGWTASGDGDIAVARQNAATFAAALGNARDAVKKARTSQIIVRGIGLENIVLDAAQAAWFDGKSWEARDVMPHPSTPQPHYPSTEIFERATGLRLADLLAETDGIWERAMPGLLILDGKRHADYRRHRLAVVDGSVEVSIKLPPAILDKLTANGADLGRAIGALVA